MRRRLSGPRRITMQERFFVTVSRCAVSRWNYKHRVGKSRQEEPAPSPPAARVRAFVTRVFLNNAAPGGRGPKRRQVGALQGVESAAPCGKLRQNPAYQKLVLESPSSAHVL